MLFKLMPILLSVTAVENAGWKVVGVILLAILVGAFVWSVSGDGKDEIL
jgi:hypothetical protein